MRHTNEHLIELLALLPLEQQVAQLFMLGFNGTTPTPMLEKFLKAGLGGVIFFRDNFDPLQPHHPKTVARLLADLHDTVPAHLPPPFFSIDQEGGLVERLPHTLFPSSLTPRAIALSPEPEKLAKTHYRILSEHLSALGFNMNFFPTLDVNLEKTNPIIGVRAFGDSPDVVWPLAAIALQQHQAHQVTPVGKHFPGHGNGTVDSHLDLPTLHFTFLELLPFQKAIEAGIPAILVAHGFYPELQRDPAEAGIPASASPTIIQGLLRDQLGFQGLIITDDMCMGAITKTKSPVDAALASLEAGVDILLYKQSTEEEWDVYQAVLQAVQQGRIPLQRIQDSVLRIMQVKQNLKPFQSEENKLKEWTSTYLQSVSEHLALQAISIQTQAPGFQLPLNTEAPILLIHPKRQNVFNYKLDIPTSPELPHWFEHAGFTQVQSIDYDFHQPITLPESSSPAVIIFVAYNALLHPEQAEGYRQLKIRFPNTPVLLVSAGTPYDIEILAEPAAHLCLCTYRPASMKVLAEFLTGQQHPITWL